MKTINERIKSLEMAFPKEVAAIVTYSNGEQKRMIITDIVNALIEKIQGSSPHIVNIDWLNKDNGTNGVFPQLIEYLSQC